MHLVQNPGAQQSFSSLISGLHCTLLFRLHAHWILTSFALPCQQKDPQHPRLCSGFSTYFWLIWFGGHPSPLGFPSQVPFRSCIVLSSVFFSGFQSVCSFVINIPHGQSRLSMKGYQWTCTCNFCKITSRPISSTQYVLSICRLLEMGE